MFLHRLDVSQNDQDRLQPLLTLLSVPYARSRSVDISKLPVWGEYACLSDYLLRLEYLWEISSNMKHHSCFILSRPWMEGYGQPHLFPALRPGKNPRLLL
jgi:hypothetical protein